MDVSAPFADVSLLKEEVSNEGIRILLEAKNEASKLTAMKKLVARIAQGRDVATMFPEVVKNIGAVKSFELKRLIHMFIMHYSSSNQELALLAVNSLHSDLKNANERIRAAALRSLSSIQLPIILPLKLLAVQSCQKDLSPYVRKAAALACMKIYKASPSSQIQESLLLILSRLADDKSPIVYPSALWVMSKMFGADDVYLDMLHRSFRFYCSSLTSLDPFSQVIVLESLLRYAKRYFPPEPTMNQNVVGSENMDPFSIETSGDVIIEHDHLLLLDSCEPLLVSANSSVVLAASKIFLYAAPRKEFFSKKVSNALMRTIGCCRNREQAYVLMKSLVAFISIFPKAFDEFLEFFYVVPSDPYCIRTLKLEIICKLAESTKRFGVVLSELRTYLYDDDLKFVQDVTKTIGVIGMLSQSYAGPAMDILMQLLRNSKNCSFENNLLGSAVVSIRQILQQHPKLLVDTLPMLITLLDKLNSPIARASIIWIVGEHRSLVPNMIPDLLRKLAKSFKDEDDKTKIQILNLAVKVKLQGDVDPEENHSSLTQGTFQKVELLVKYILQLSKYDRNVDIRDRTRFFSALIASFDPHFAENKEQNPSCAEIFTSVAATCFKDSLLISKNVPPFDSASHNGLESNLVIGTLSHLLSRVIGSSYRHLPEFLFSIPETSRDCAISPKFSEAKDKTSGNIQSMESTLDKEDIDRDSGSGWSSDSSVEFKANVDSPDSEEQEMNDGNQGHQLDQESSESERELEIGFS